MTTNDRTATQDRLFDPDEQTPAGKSFRLSLETRQRNLAHIARIRREIAERRSAA